MEAKKKKQHIFFPFFFFPTYFFRHTPPASKDSRAPPPAREGRADRAFGRAALMLLQEQFPERLFPWAPALSRLLDVPTQAGHSPGSLLRPSSSFGDT